MTRTKRMALAFYLGAALAGAVVGVSLDRFVVRSDAAWWDQRAMRSRFYDQLHLTPAQRDSAGLVFDERNRKQDSILTPVRPALDSVGAELRQRISQLLTPEQKAVYDQMQRERERTQRPTEKK
jgi:Spy/CpxP family protein refolding chaperone